VKLTLTLILTRLPNANSSKNSVDVLKYLLQETHQEMR